MSRTSAGSLPVVQCSVCAAVRLEPFAFGEHTMQRCAACGAVLSTTYDDPDAAYDERYHSGESGRFVDTDHPTFQDYLRRCNRERLDVLDRATTARGRLLDVGCARGDLLALAAADGWSVTGVERVESAAEVARSRHGIDVRAGTLESAAFEPASFDVVGAFHLLEHLPNAVEFLGELRGLTRPGGLVFLEVPNWRSVSRRHYGERWPHLHPGDHITHFTATTLRGALRAADLELVSISSPSFTGTPQDLDAAAADLCLGRRSRRVLARLTTTEGRPGRVGWQLLHGIDAVYSRLRVGVVLLVVARRPG